MHKILLSCAVVLLFLSQGIIAQKVHFSIGKNSTDFQFVDRNNIKSDFLMPSSGDNLNIGFSRAFLDTLSLQAKSSEKALKYMQKPLLSKLLSHLDYSFGLNFSQYNAVGQIQNIVLDYQTDFAGLDGGIGFRVNLLQKIALFAKGTVLAQKFIRGRELAGTNYFDLKGNAQFDNVKILTGYKAGISYKINTSTDLIVEYSSFSTTNSSLAETGKFDLKTQAISMGLAFQIN